jgi:hypothetical protein
VRVRIAPLPATHLWEPTHVSGVHATEAFHAGSDVAFIVVLPGVRNPDSDPANRYRCGSNCAKVIAAVPPWEVPTIACPLALGPC